MLALPLPRCHEFDLEPGLNLAVTAWQSPCSDSFINSLDSWLCIPWDSFYPTSTSPIKFTMIFNSLHACLIPSPLPQTLLCLNKPYPFVKSPLVMCVCCPCGSHCHSSTQASSHCLLSENFNSDSSSNFNTASNQQRFFVHSSSSIHLTSNAFQRPVINKLWLL